MDFNEVIKKRHTAREFLKVDVDYEIIKRIIEAGCMAPTWDHYRGWQFIVLHSKKEKEAAFGYAKNIAEKFNVSKYEGKKLSPNMVMYTYAMPLQYSMLVGAAYVIVPIFKSWKLNAEYVSKLNPFSTIWCVIENMFLAAANEGVQTSIRIPLNKEHDDIKEKLGVPDGYYIPCLIGVGYEDPNAYKVPQVSFNVESKIHKGRF